MEQKATGTGIREVRVIAIVAGLVGQQCRGHSR